jgi:predicted porin
VTAARDLLDRVQALVPEQAAAPEEQRDSPETLPVIRAFRFYGSLRARMFVNPGGELSFDGQTSRIGVRAEYPLSKKIKGFARGELGFNFFDATQRIFGGDPGRTDEDNDSLFTLRLAFIGVETTRGRISFGKQWSAYYDVAVFSDQMPFLAAQGTGVFNAGTDGGVSGTGRADNALQYRHSIGGYKFTAQVQIRNLTDNSQPFADTWSLSAARQWNKQIYVGAAYNDVRDGVPEPAADQPKEGDRSFIVGARYEKDRLYAAGTMTLFRQHEKDDLERFFDGLGLELYCDYTWWEKLRARAALSYLEPESDHPGEFSILAITAGASYDFTKRIRGYLLARIDFSKLSDGSSADRDTLNLSVFYTF